jgi:NADH-ubiquinone oxidoreductase chain 2
MYTNFLYDGLFLYGGLLFCENYTYVFSIFIFVLSMFILLITSFYPRKTWSENDSSFISVLYKNNILGVSNTSFKNKMSEQYRLIEYPLLILFCLSGAIFLLSSSDIISVFLSIELQSYSLYLIASIYRDSERSVNAGLTYFLLGGLSSCIILLAQSLLYVNSGNTNLNNIYIIKNISDFSTNNSDIINNTDIYLYYIQFSLILMVIGFLFKISSAPFHFWSPDVYDAVPTIVTTFIAIIAKISILAFLFQLSYYASTSTLSISWLNIVMISSMLSLIIGSVLGLTQYRIKRLFAYSTISHIGFILLALAINNTESTQAFFFYIIQYSMSNLNAFIILICIGYTLYDFVYKSENVLFRNLRDLNNSPVQLISQLKGYFSINPFLSISMAITLFSFVGIPPLVGFFGKQMVLSAAIGNGFIFITLIGIITSVISAVYYLAIVKQIFFDNSEYKLYHSKEDISYVYISSGLSTMIALITLLIMLFMFYNNDLLLILYLNK